MHTTKLSLEYHQQDMNVYCGAACAQMVLRQVGAQLYDQIELFEDIKANSTTEEIAENWSSAPTGLFNVMNLLNPIPDIHRFDLYAELKEDIISRKIIWTISHYRISPIALVRRGGHWVSVTGFQTSKPVARDDDTSYIIFGFFLNNPSPVTPIPNPPPPHKTGDRCGTGGRFGTVNHHIAYSTWKEDYLTYVRFGTSWKGMFIAVCDPDPLPKKVGKQIPVQILHDGEKIIDKETAAKYAEESMKDYQLPNQYFLKNILRGVKPGNPILVQRYDRNNDFYYLVPMQNQKGNIYSFVSVDGRFGNYRESAFAKDLENPLVFEQLNREDILKILGTRLHLDQKGNGLIIYPEALVISPVMIWMPCLESLSPYLPFYLIIIGNNRVFVRIDGQVFTELTTNARGA